MEDGRVESNIGDLKNIEQEIRNKKAELFSDFANGELQEIKEEAAIFISKILILENKLKRNNSIFDNMFVQNLYFHGTQQIFRFTNLSSLLNENNIIRQQMEFYKDDFEEKLNLFYNQTFGWVYLDEKRNSILYADKESYENFFKKGLLKYGGTGGSRSSVSVSNFSLEEIKKELEKAEPNTIVAQLNKLLQNRHVSYSGVLSEAIQRYLDPDMRYKKRYQGKYKNTFWYRKNEKYPQIGWSQPLGNAGRAFIREGYLSALLNDAFVPNASTEDNLRTLANPLYTSSDSKPAGFGEDISFSYQNMKLGIAVKSTDFNTASFESFIRMAIFLLTTQRTKEEILNLTKTLHGQNEITRVAFSVAQLAVQEIADRIKDLT